MCNFLKLQLDHSNLILFYRCMCEVHTCVHMPWHMPLLICVQRTEVDVMQCPDHAPLYTVRRVSFWFQNSSFQLVWRGILCHGFSISFSYIFWDYRFFEMLRRFLYGFWKLNSTPNSFPASTLGVESSPQSLPSFHSNFFSITIIDLHEPEKLKLSHPGFIILFMYCSGGSNEYFYLIRSQWVGLLDWLTNNTCDYPSLNFKVIVKCLRFLKCDFH